jgi:hypothetical protein
MDLAEFQQMRNEKAKQLSDLPYSERYKKAVELAKEMEQISCENGFITQTYHWVFMQAGLLKEPQLELFG